MKRSILPIIMLGAFALCLIGTGSAAWVFQSTKTVEVAAEVQVNEFKFSTIPAEVEDASDELLYCLLNPNTTEGKALTAAKSAEESRWKPAKDWVGNESKTSSTTSNLNTALPSSAYINYLIKYVSNNTVEFYGTNDTLSYPPAKTVTVYKYTYTKSNGTWAKSTGVEGTCQTTYYWLAGGDYSASFNTGTFVAK